MLRSQHQVFYLCGKKVEKIHQLNQVDLLIPYMIRIQLVLGSAADKILPCKLTFFLLNFRQLSVERDTLKNSLERESAKSKRLSLENEELQWRLVNSTSPPRTPTDEGGPMAKQHSYRLSASYPEVEAIDE